MKSLDRTWEKSPSFVKLWLTVVKPKPRPLHIPFLTKHNKHTFIFYREGDVVSVYINTACAQNVDCSDYEKKRQLQVSIQLKTTLCRVLRSNQRDAIRRKIKNIKAHHVSSKSEITGRVLRSQSDCLSDNKPQNTKFELGPRRLLTFGSFYLLFYQCKTLLLV